MAQPNQITAAMIDVLTEFVHDNRISAGGRPEAPGRRRSTTFAEGLSGLAHRGNTCSAIMSGRRAVLAGGAAALVARGLRAQPAGKPKVTVISQWSSGSSGAAMVALGKEFERQGGVWEHDPVPGFTTEMMNKLRAQIIAGDPPAASQLKGPEIAAWSKIAPVVDLDAMVKAAGYEAVVPAELARLSKPHGHWIALPVQAYRINTPVHLEEGGRPGRRDQAAHHLGGVQRDRREDEGGRHHPDRQWRHQMGRRHEVGDRALRHQPRCLSQGAHGAGREDAEGARGAGRVPAVPQAGRAGRIPASPARTTPPSSRAS